MDRFPVPICPIGLEDGLSLREVRVSSRLHPPHPNTYTHTHLSLACHLNASIEELIEIVTELPGGRSQLPALPAGGMDHFPSGLVQVGRCLVQFALGLLERLRARR